MGASLSRGHQSYLAEILQVSGALVVGETATGNLNMPYCHNNEGVLAQGQNLAAAEPQQKRRFFSYLSLVSPSQVVAARVFKRNPTAQRRKILSLG